MANDAAKKNKKAWELWVKIVGGITGAITLLFVYFGILSEAGLGFWNWIGYILILITYGFTIMQVLNSIANGLPRPEMYWDGLITAWGVNLLMIFSGWFWFILLWVPILYIYKAINQFKQLAGFGQGQAMPSNDYGAPQSGKKKRNKKKRRR